MALSTTTIYIDSNKLLAAKIPSGHTVATSESSLGTEDIKESYSWNLAASDSVAATAGAGFDDLLKTELKADIDAFIAANTGLGIDITTHTVSYNARVTDIKYGENASDMYKTSANVNFVVSFELRVYISA